MLPLLRGGVAALGGSAAFAPVTERVAGNQLPGWTGSPGNNQVKAPPHPDTQVMGGQVGNFDGSSGSDPSRAKMQPHPRRVHLGAEQETFRRYGIIGFNDQLQVRDRHVYWDRGTQRFRGPGNETGGSRNPQLDGRARPDLRAVNISVNPQIGSDNSRNQDDLTRPYTWLGQQDGTVQPVYGGVPGLWISYGNRGLPDGIHDPTGGQGGLAVVYPGPPHGLHSDTIPSGKQIADRYKVTPQMKPVRIDRPDNSRIAGQSYSQTVVPQGATAAQHQQKPATSMRAGISLRAGGRGWRGGMG